MKLDEREKAILAQFYESEAYSIIKRFYNDRFSILAKALFMQPVNEKSALVLAEIRGRFIESEDFLRLPEVLNAKLKKEKQNG